MTILNIIHRDLLTLSLSFNAGGLQLMQWWQAIILGIVEGLTEYLPVSSTGHLLVVQQLIGIDTGSDQAKEAADAYAICIQGGAILAVLGLYFSRVKGMALGVVGKSPEGLRLFYRILLAFIPAVVIGLTFNSLIKQYLFGPWPVVVAWFIGGVGILLVVYYHQRKALAQNAATNSPDGSTSPGDPQLVTPTKDPGLSLEAMTLQMAIIIGFAQCVAMWPGVSRSLMTIVAGVLVGLSLRSAVEFSFLLGVITLGAATAYDALKHGSQMLDAYGIMPLILGFVFAFISAVIAIKWMVAYLNNHSMAIFGWYRIAIALIVATLLLTGVLPDQSAS